MWRTSLMLLGLLLALCLGAELRGDKADEREYRVGLVDLKQVFDKLEHVKEQSAALRREVEAKDREVKVKADELKARLEEHKKLPPERQKEDRPELEKLQQAYKSFLEEHKKAFLKRESDLYETTYHQVIEEIGRQAQRRKMDLVIRMNDPAEQLPEGQGSRTPEQVLKMLNNSILFHRPEMNLTNDVLEALNSR